MDVVHGHSSHHLRAIEVHRGKPILYGCGDFLNDYEGIGGYEELRGELSLMVFVELEPATRSPVRLTLVPMRIERFRLTRASREEAEWLAATLTRVGHSPGTRVERGEDDTLSLCQKR